jgi:alcohol dehydrogenase class IV
MSIIHTYSFPTLIHAGAGSRSGLPDGLRDRGVCNPLVVTDATLVELEPMQQLRETLGAITHGVFSGIKGNPVLSFVDSGVEAYRQGGHDALIALGGGAAMDVAKCIALMVHHPGVLLDYQDSRSDARPVNQEIPPLFALPTTAGTGSEVGRSAVVSDDTSKVKYIIFSPRLLPVLVFLDAELTLTLPAGVTAATGMDALTHLVESYIAKGHHPLCDGIALEGIYLISQHLEHAVQFAKDPQHANLEDHLHARDGMLHAAMMGAVAFQKGLGVTHSCAHALSTVCDTHHGLANGVMVTYAMSFNLATCGQRFAQMAQVAGLADTSAEGFLTWLHDLQDKTGIPRKLSQLGVTVEHLDALVECAVHDPCHQLNPRPVTREDFEALFQQALHGAS